MKFQSLGTTVIKYYTTLFVIVYYIFSPVSPVLTEKDKDRERESEHTNYPLSGVSVID